MATCHPERLHHSRGLCEQCYRKWRFEHNPKLAEKHRREVREYARKHRDKTLRISHEQSLKRCGITEEDYQTLLVLQDSKCAICKTHLNGTWHHGPQTDHNHETGAARGLLCSDCNTKLGKIEDEAWRALAGKYLSKFVKVDAKVEPHES